MTDSPSPAPQGGWQRSLLEFAPLIAFFAAYKLSGLMAATLAMVVATAASLALTYVREKRVAVLPLVSGLCILIFGGLTLLLNDELFIKLRPTIVNALSGATLLIGVYGFRRGWMRHIFAFAFQLTDRGWWLLSRRWGFFFLGMAVLNELIWRSVPTELWVNIKVFGYMGLTMLFTLAQLPLLTRHAAPQATDKIL